MKILNYLNLNLIEISLHTGGDVRGLFKMPKMRKEYKINLHHPTYKGLLFKFTVYNNVYNVQIGKFEQIFTMIKLAWC